MEFIFAAIFLWSIISMSTMMLALQIEIVEYNDQHFAWEPKIEIVSVFQQQGVKTSELLQRCNQTFSAFAVVFICCEFGQKLSKSFDRIDHVITQLDWYRFPVNVCKFLPTFIAGAQEPTVLRVFGSICCTRTDFKNVRSFSMVHFEFSWPS